MPNCEWLPLAIAGPGCTDEERAPNRKPGGESKGVTKVNYVVAPQTLDLTRTGHPGWSVYGK
jgi:hypothetical protein